MKLFLSWSGNESNQLATIFKEWLPNVLQYTQPYMSAKDISLGEMWNNNIRNNLEASVFGLIFVTPSNINAPWINYEAGALTKTMDSKVVPILYKADVLMLNQGPLKQFQSAKSLGKVDIYSLLESINNSTENGKLDETRLQKAFDIWWPNLDEQISKIVNDVESPAEDGPTDKELLSSIFSKLVDQERLLKNNGMKSKEKGIPRKLIHDLRTSCNILERCRVTLDGGPYPDEFFSDIEKGIQRLERAISFLLEDTSVYRLNLEDILDPRKRA